MEKNSPGQDFLKLYCCDRDWGKCMYTSLKSPGVVIHYHGSEHLYSMGECCWIEHTAQGSGPTVLCLELRGLETTAEQTQSLSSLVA